MMVAFGCGNLLYFRCVPDMVVYAVNCPAAVGDMEICDGSPYIWWVACSKIVLSLMTYDGGAGVCMCVTMRRCKCIIT